MSFDPEAKVAMTVLPLRFSPRRTTIGAPLGEGRGFPMTWPSRTSLLLATALGVSLALGAIAGSADAAATLGQTFVPTTGCAAATLVQKLEGPGVPSYAAPAGGGVITAWSTETDPNTSQTARFKVFRPTGKMNEYFIVAETSTASLAPSALNTFPTRIPVQAGDRIGLFSGNDCLGPSSGSTVELDNGDFAPGTTHTFTTGYANGALDLSARVESDADSDGYGDETQDQCFTDPSTQAPCPAPTIAGAAQDGKQLVANPNGSPINPSYQWLRCDQAGANCTPIAGAMATSYAVGVSDEGHTLRFRKTASDSSGTQTTDSAQTALVPYTAPVESAVSMLRTRFRVASFPTPLVASRAKRGSAFRYSLDQPATIKIKIYATAKGRKVRRRCRAPSRRNQGKPACKRLVLKGTLTRSGNVGTNYVPFSGRIGNRALAPGRYQAAIVATNAGGKSTTRTVSFTIVRR